MKKVKRNRVKCANKECNEGFLRGPDEKYKFLCKKCYKRYYVNFKRFYSHEYLEQNINQVIKEDYEATQRAVRRLFSDDVCCENMHI